MTKEILKNIKDKNYTIGIVGLGYVGLPLLWTFHEKNFNLIGFDVDQRKLDHFNEGTTYIKHFVDDQIKMLRDSDRCDITLDFTRINEVDAIILCVPTPLDTHREPDMSYVEATVRTVAPHMKKGQILILESTTYPGTTDELIKPISEELSGLKAGVDFFLAYSPEREDPGNPDFRTASIPKVVGADGQDALDIAVTLYEQAIVQVVPVSSTRTAEAVKLTENIFRSVNIALVNELKLVFQRMDIDIFEVIDAAKTKPFGFMPFYPGPGLGGHCIPIDPFYLTWKAREYGIHTKFIELAGEVNTAMPHYVIERTMEALNSKKKSLNGSKVLCLGLAYKPNVDDMRESPTFVIMDELKQYGADVSFYDPYIPEITPTREHAQWTGTESCAWDEDTIRQFDVIIITTNHAEINYQELVDWCPLIVDTRNALNGLDTSKTSVWRA